MMKTIPVYELETILKRWKEIIDMPLDPRDLTPEAQDMPSDLRYKRTIRKVCISFIGSVILFVWMNLFISIWPVEDHDTIMLLYAIAAVVAIIFMRVLYDH